MTDFYSYDALPLAVFEDASGTPVNLLDLLTNVYGDQVGSIASIQIMWRDATYLQNAPAPAASFSYWDPNNPVVTSVLNNGVPIPAQGATTTVNPTTGQTEGVRGAPNPTTVANADFANITIDVGNNIMPNVYLTIEWANDGTDRAFQELTVTTVPDQRTSLAAFDGTVTANDIVATARAFATAYNGAANANDCHWMAMTIAAAAGAALDPMTQDIANPGANEEGGLWRIVHRGSDNPVDNWQTLVQPGDIVRMGWTGGGFHTVTVTQGLNGDGAHPGQICVVDNTARDASGNSIISEHWVDFDGIGSPDDTVDGSITIYRLSPDQRFLTNGSALDDTIIGTVLNDEIRGGDGRDGIYGGDGADVLLGGAGNDWFEGGAGADRLEGGAGIDQAQYTDATAGVRVDLLDPASNTGDAAGDTFSLVEDLRGTAFSDILLGDDEPNAIGGWTGGNDRLFGRGGNDALATAGGADVLDGGTGADTMAGGLGNDTYVVDNVGDVVTEGANAGIDTVRSSISYTLGANVENLVLTGAAAINGTGNTLNNSITGNGAANILDGGLGADVLDGGAGVDTVSYAASAAGVTVDFATGTGHGGDAEGDTYIGIEHGIGSGFDDMYQGGAVHAKFLAGEGNDTLVGGSVFDWLDGGKGNDTIIGTGAQTVMFGGDGDDTLTGSLTRPNHMYGGHGNDTITGGDWTDLIFETEGGNETIRGGGGNDTIIDHYGVNDLYGEAGNDWIISVSREGSLLDGGGDDDTLLAHFGGNTLLGGAGNDILENNEGGAMSFFTGGADADTFVFRAGISIETPVTVTDFEDGVDHIGLRFQPFEQLTITDTVEGAVIEYYGTSPMLLAGVSASQITQQDFLSV